MDADADTNADKMIPMCHICVAGDTKILISIVLDLGTLTKVVSNKNNNYLIFHVSSYPYRQYRLNVDLFLQVKVLNYIPMIYYINWNTSNK